MGRLIAAGLAALLLAGCGGAPRPQARPSLAQAARKYVGLGGKRRPNTKMSLSSGSSDFSAEDAQGRQILKAKAASMNGNLVGGKPDGPVKMEKTAARLFQHGDPQIDLKMPEALWDGKFLTTDKTVHGVTVDNKTIMDAQQAKWTASNGDLLLHTAKLQAMQAGKVDFTAEGPQAFVRNNVVMMDSGAVARNPDGRQLTADHIRWHLKTGALEANGNVILTDQDMRVTGDRLKADTKLRRGRLFGGVRLHMKKPPIQRGKPGKAPRATHPGRRAMAEPVWADPIRRCASTRGAAVILAAAMTASLPLVARAGAPKDAPAAKPAQSSADGQQHAQYGATDVSGDEIEYDLTARQFVFTGHAMMVSQTTRVTSNQMTVQVTPSKTLEWAKCEGNVNVHRTNPADNSVMTARAPYLDYFETEKKANMRGGVEVHQSAPSLAKPTVITGDHVDLNLKTDDDVVFGDARRQAKVHVEPKGQEGKPAPEPVDLDADRIQMNGHTQEYEATGRPIMERPSGRLTARRIRFTVDSKSNEVKVGYADDDVIYDGRDQNGTVMHVTGDHGTFNRDTHETIVTGNVRAASKKPEEEEPTVLTGDRWVHNSLTQRSKMTALPGRTSRVVLPAQQTAAARGGDSAAAGGTKGGAAPEKGGAGKKAQ